jgi:hypothetical protein
MLKEICLTLPEVETFIRSLEEKYELSTVEFLRDPASKEKVSEDDIFEWEAYVDHRRELRLIEEDVRRKYIQCLSQSSKATTSDRPSTADQLALAA